MSDATGDAPNMSRTIHQLTEIALRFRDERDWKQFHNAKDLMLTLNLEASELLEHAQWRNGDDLEAHLRQKKTNVADELADVLHVILLLAEHLDIDLGDAFVKKMAKNAEKYPVGKARGSAKKYTEL